MVYCSFIVIHGSMLYMKISLRFLLVLFSLLSMSHKSLAIATIIAELDNIFIREDRKKTIWEVGPSNFIGWYNPATIQEDYFKLLDSMLPYQPGEIKNIRDGYVIPKIINDWLTNKQTPEQIRSFVIQKLKEVSTMQGRSTKIPQGIANCVFTPARYASTMVVQKKAVDILKKCREKGHKLCLLTNWNTESFNCLMQNHEIKSMLSLFDFILISGNAHMFKPDPKFFEYAFSYFNVDFTQPVYYLDSEINNINVVQSLCKPNLTCIYCKNSDITSIDNEFRRRHIYQK